MHTFENVRTGQQTMDPRNEISVPKNSETRISWLSSRLSVLNMGWAVPVMPAYAATVDQVVRSEVSGHSDSYATRQPPFTACTAELNP